VKKVKWPAAIALGGIAEEVGSELLGESAAILQEPVRFFSVNTIRGGSKLQI
jgi:hypothetical protein